jgi:hypothetical protein
MNDLGLGEERDKGTDGTPEARHEWARAHNHCFVCFRSADEAGSLAHREWWHLQSHEIERRSHAKKDMVFLRVNLFRACSVCHAGPLATMPHAKQLALAYFSDPERAPSVRAMLKAWLPIRCGRTGPDRVTVMDVVQELGDITRAQSGINGWRKYVVVRDRYMNLVTERARAEAAR